MYHCHDRLSDINGVIRPGIVHRIDKDTSGLLMVAKTNEAHLSLSEQIKAHSFTREYEAIALGRFREKRGRVEAPIGRDPKNRLKMAVTQKNSREAATNWQVLGENDRYSWLRLRLETGRTHQIRVHMAYLGHPLLGDELYGRPVKNLQGQCLYAKRLGFIHPVTGKYMEFSCEMPDYFAKIVRTMERLEPYADGREGGEQE
jgi:23S rRNA pseudouridine1911/1915/1917 synthase